MSAICFWSRKRESNPPESAWEADAIPLGDSCNVSLIIKGAKESVKRFCEFLQISSRRAPAAGRKNHGEKNGKGIEKSHKK